MPLDLGRVTHLIDQMHRSEDDAGDPIAAGMLLAADGARGQEWIDPGTITSGLMWFNVTDPAYGAVGDGTTDDRAAINLAIAALNSAGAGVLYFPATTASYYVSNALTALTVPCLVLGDGKGTATTGGSIVKTDHATAKLFTVSDNFIEFRGLGLICTATTPASGGAGIATTSGHGGVCTYRNLWVSGFFDCLALQHGGRWLADGVDVINPSRYGIWIANQDVPDGGDWYISNTTITTDSAATHTPTSAIRQDSAGGGKVVNLKVNGDTAHEFVTGYDLNINGAANKTTILTLTTSSIENVTGDAILITTTGTGGFGLISLSGFQVGLYSNNTGRAVKISAATHGALPANGSIGVVVIDDLVARTDGTARAAIELVNTDLVTLGEMALSGFNARYTSSGDTNTVDAGGASSGGTVTSVAMTVPAEFSVAGSPITTSGTLALTKANESANTVWAGPTSGGAAAPTFRALVAADIPAVTLTEAQVYGVGGHWEVLMDPATSSPPVPLETPDGTDWVYGWLSDGG